MATVFSLFVAVIAVFRKSIVYEEMGGITTWQIVAFYYGAGTAGGLLLGVLRPIQHRYVGKFITAYVLLFLVYGGGSVVLGPVLSGTDQDSPPLLFLLAFCAILCLLLAPIYVRITRRW